MTTPLATQHSMLTDKVLRPWGREDRVCPCGALVTGDGRHIGAEGQACKEGA